MECIYNSSILEFKDFLVLALGFLLSVCWTIILYRLKPNLLIESVNLVDKELRVKVLNKGKYDAINLKLEACAIKDDHTFHLKIDKNDLIILPKQRKHRDDSSNFRIFKIDNISESASKYTNYKDLLANLTNEKKDYQLRIRIHANHEYSGFGKAFESKFTFEKGKFIKTK